MESKEKIEDLVGSSQRLDPQPPTDAAIAGYQFLELIGEGGLSVIYKARQTLLNKIVAIKILRADLVSNETTLKRFQQEAKAASKLSHQNIAAIHDFGILPNGQPYIVMDYVDGGNLADLIEKEGTLSPERTIALFTQITAALEHSHAQGLLHRDLKPGNVMLDTSDGVEKIKLVDFGIAKLMLEKSGDDETLTRTGEIFGSPAYMSPEQCLGRKVDARTDIYSLGCMMLEAATGKPPFEGETSLELIFKQVNEKAEVPVGNVLGPVLKKALQKNPQQRYQKMSDVTRDLKSIREGKKPANTMIPKVVAASLATLLIGAAIGLATFYMQGHIKPPVTTDTALTPREEELSVLIDHNREFVQLNDELISRNVVNKLSSMPTLRGLDISRSRISRDDMAELLKGLKKHESLKDLCISGVWTNDNALKGMGDIQSLTGIDATQTSIADGTVARLVKLPKLEFLILTNTMISDASVKALSQAKKLKYLDLSGNANAVRNLEPLTALPELETLVVANSLFDDNAIENLTKIHSLKRLVLNDNLVTDKHLQLLTKLKLTHISLQHTSVSNNGLRYLAAMPSLTGLNVSNCAAGSEWIPELKNLQHLKLLGVAYLPVDDKDVRLIVKQFPELQILLLRGTHVTGKSIDSIAQLKDLTSLNVANTDIKYNDIVALMKKVPMRRITVSAHQVSDAQKQSLNREFRLCTVDIAKNGGGDAK